MILKSEISEVVNSFKQRLSNINLGVRRTVNWELPGSSSLALIISGIRRSGKSTLMYQLINELEENWLFLNFDDPRLFGFELNDFNRLNEIIEEGNYKCLFFDEIQLVANWERYIRQLIDFQKYRIVISGSNASMLSKELGTHLTGRHISKELFPFSYKEFLSISNLPEGADATAVFLDKGGFPEFLKTNNYEVLSGVLNDIIYRDISVRFGVRNHLALKQLAVYLISNVGKLFTANSLRKIIPVAATSTILEYLGHFEDTYLAFFVPKFSYSYSKQIQNPRKIYAIDTGIVTANTVSFTADVGRKFENLVFLTLRRNYNEIFYFSEKNECDFVVCINNKPEQLVQACYHLNRDNLHRETEALYEAMTFFGMKEGVIVTFDQNDRFNKGDMLIQVLPFHEWATTV
ncbi:MAG: ATP-binding protein [Prolixibacteraceae bacterium]|nr:ATP-binding protein [Prolixibacteraceae bacterium]